MNVFASRAMKFNRLSALPFEAEEIDQEIFGSPYQDTNKFCSVCFELFQDRKTIIILRSATIYLPRRPLTTI